MVQNGFLERQKDKLRKFAKKALFYCICGLFNLSTDTITLMRKNCPHWKYGDDVDVMHSLSIHGERFGVYIEDSDMDALYQSALTHLLEHYKLKIKNAFKL